MFLEEKTTQAAARLIKLSGGEMPYPSLLKLLYLADKQMLLTWGIPMTYDRWVSMKHGPVLSNTLDLIKGKSGYWSQHIQTQQYDVVLTADPGDDLLSEAEDGIIDRVFAEHGAKGKWELHELAPVSASWDTPGSSSRPITYSEVLQVEGLSDDDIQAVLKAIAEREEAELALR